MNYHGQMINIQVDQAKLREATPALQENKVQSYKLGHRDARHAAALLAIEADATIERLTAEVDALAADRDALTKLTSDLLAENAGLRDKADRLAAELAVRPPW